MRNNISKILIILPTYNAEKFLERGTINILTSDVDINLYFYL